MCTLRKEKGDGFLCVLPFWPLLYLICSTWKCTAYFHSISLYRTWYIF